MKQVPLDNLTPRQRQAYILRLRRIAAELGITVSSAGVSREDVAQHILVQMVRHVAR